MTMKTTYINELNLEQSTKLRDAYNIILFQYEELLGGPWACHGIAEYHAVKSSIMYINKHIQALWEAQ